MDWTQVHRDNHQASAHVTYNDDWTGRLRTFDVTFVRSATLSMIYDREQNNENNSDLLGGSLEENRRARMDLSDKALLFLKALDQSQVQLEE